MILIKPKHKGTYVRQRFYFSLLKNRRMFPSLGLNFQDYQCPFWFTQFQRLFLLIETSYACTCNCIVHDWSYITKITSTPSYLRRHPLSSSCNLFSLGGVGGGKTRNEPKERMCRRQISSKLTIFFILIICSLDGISIMHEKIRSCVNFTTL